MDNEVKKKHTRLRRARLFQEAPIILLMILFLLVSIAFFFDPGNIDSALGVSHPFDYYWNSFYFAGSLLSLIGILSRRVGIEAAGKVLLLPGLLINLIVAFSVLGVHVTTILLLNFLVGFAFRALGLLMGWQEGDR